MVSRVDIDGVSHAYELTPQQDAPFTLVFVHGWLLSREYWHPIVERLSESFQCLTYDLRGFGDSQPASTSSPASRSQFQTLSELRQPAPLLSVGTGDRASVAANPPPEQPSLSFSSNYSPAAYAQDLLTLLKHLNISNAWVIGHSLGGSIALWTANLAPDCVRGVICINSGGGIYLKEDFERFRAAGQQLVKLRPRWLCHLPLVDLMMTRVNVARPVPRYWGKKRLVDWVNAHPEAALGTLLDSTTEAEVHYLPCLISRLKQPVHFIAGSNDTVMEPQYVRHLASFHPSFQACGSNVTEIPNCGHMSMIEQPEAVSLHVQDILLKYTARV